MAKIRGKEKIIIVCQYENWCVTWFNQLLRFLALNIYSEKRGLIKENRRHKCICIPEKEIIFISESKVKVLTRGMKPDKIIRWTGDDINELWNQI